MPRKRPNLSDVADEVSRLGRSKTAPEPQLQEGTGEVLARADPGDFWRKFTAMYRDDQLANLEMQIARLGTERVKVSASEMMRLALDNLLDRMREDKDTVLLELYEQEQRESAQSETRKFGRTRGLEKYLKRSGKM